MAKTRTFSKKVKTEQGEKTVSFDLSTLMEGLMPSLTKDSFLVPGFNAKLEMINGKMIATHIPGKRILKSHFLTPVYEQRLIELIQPILEEIQRFSENLRDDGFNWNAQLGEIVGELIDRVISAIPNFHGVVAQASSTICEASIKLEAIYGATELTDEDYIDINRLSVNYFLENVPSEYQLREIVLYQYSKMSVAEIFKLFFSTVANYLSTGMGNLIAKQTS